MSGVIRYPIVLLDADNTLFDFYRAEREALCDALLKMGVTPTEEMIPTYSAINEALWKRLERGEVTKTDLRELRFVEFCKRFALSLDVPKLATMYTDALSQKSYLLPGAMEVCRTLSRHCRLYIITNGVSSVQRGRFEPALIRPYIRELFISEEIGFEKPRREYFDAVAAAIPDFLPEKTLVVGDSLTSDIRGGISAGLDTCWFNPSGKPVPSDLPITYVIRTPEELIPLVLGA